VTPEATAATMDTLRKSTLNRTSQLLLNLFMMVCCSMERKCQHLCIVRASHVDSEGCHSVNLRGNIPNVTFQCCRGGHITSSQSLILSSDQTQSSRAFRRIPLLFLASRAGVYQQLSWTPV
jgi:hypothetical protein